MGDTVLSQQHLQLLALLVHSNTMFSIADAARLPSFSYLKFIGNVPWFHNEINHDNKEPIPSIKDSLVPPLQLHHIGLLSSMSVFWEQSSLEK